MGGGSALENNGELSVCMPSGFPDDVEPPPQSVADEERPQKIELDCHKTTGTYEAAISPQGPKPIGAKRVFACKPNKHGLIVKKKTRLIVKGFSQVQDVDCFQAFAPTPSSAQRQRKFCRLLPMNIVERFFTQTSLKLLSSRNSTPRHTGYMKPPGGCGDKSGKIVRLNKITVRSTGERTAVGWIIDRERGRVRYGAE